MPANAVTIDIPEGLPFAQMIREFEHPVEKLYRAHAERELVQRWLAPAEVGLVVEEWDAVPGGRYRHRSVHDGVEYAFNGRFHTARPHEAIIVTFELERFPGAVGVDNYRFEPLEGGRSRLTIWSVYPSLAARDGAVRDGMEPGLVGAYDRCEHLLAGL
jgi:uncharacterized protein YndB with AHSA1/START domain